ncbi:Uncharacterised protein [Mycobacteroides abscessus subsp. abscessus]|nr:Uncharacterised protein [Mycobacteroides abscessus subsp. abscessus]
MRGDLIGPIGEAQSAVLVFGRPRRDGIGLAAGIFDGGECLFPRLTDADIETRWIQLGVGAHDS